MFLNDNIKVARSTGGSGGSTPDFQAGEVRGSIPEPSANGNFLSTSTDSWFGIHLKL